MPQKVIREKIGQNTVLTVPISIAEMMRLAEFRELRRTCNSVISNRLRTP